MHINIAELEAFLREEARAGSRRPCHRFVFGLDSQVALGAAVKGRSASPPSTTCSLAASRRMWDFTLSLTWFSSLPR